VFASWDDGVRNYLATVMRSPRYAASARALRDGSLVYMRQLGVDGWYGQPPAKSDAIWKGAMRRIAPIIGVEPLRTSAAGAAAFGGILIAVLRRVLGK
jgi:hypothetical protein